jgi:hypothetical protein
MRALVGMDDARKTIHLYFLCVEGQVRGGEGDGVFTAPPAHVFARGPPASPPCPVAAQLITIVADAGSGMQGEEEIKRFLTHYAPPLGASSSWVFMDDGMMPRP